jgi:hypothetical protein
MWSGLGVISERTDSMQLGLSSISLAKSLSESNSLSAATEITRNLWNPKVHYRIHKSLLPFSILSQTNQFQVLHPNTLRPVSVLSCHLRLGLPSGLFPSLFVTKSHLIPHDSATKYRIWRAVEIAAPFFMKFSSFSCYFLLVRPSYLSQHPVLEHTQLM